MDKCMHRRPLHHACKIPSYVCNMWYRMNLPERDKGVERDVLCFKCATVGQLFRPECQLYGNRLRGPDPAAKGRTTI
jgi:hypothetical protein